MKDSDLVFLVAATDANFRAEVAGTLKEIGFGNVRQTDDGTVAWSIVKNEGVQFMVAGLELGELNGLALLKIVRADPHLADMPYMLMTDAVTKQLVGKAGAAGVSDILCLPLQPGVLEKKVKELLAEERDPQLLEAHNIYQKGMAEMEHGRYEKAVKAFHQVLELHEDAYVYYNLGYIRTAEEKYEDAIRCFRKATEINNAFARAYEKMGECYTKLGRPKEAEQCFHRAAEVYIEKRMDDEAEQVLIEVLKLNPDSINVYNSLGIQYRRQGKFQKAIEQYRRALRVNPNDENIYYNLGRLQFDLKEYAKARDALRTALKINPEFDDGKALLREVESKLASDQH